MVCSIFDVGCRKLMSSIFEGVRNHVNIKMEEEQMVKDLSSTIRKSFFRCIIRTHRENYNYLYF